MTLKELRQKRQHPTDEQYRRRALRRLRHRAQEANRLYNLRAKGASA